MKKALIYGGAYVAIGFGTALWLKSREKSGKPVFGGFGNPPKWNGFQAVALWPLFVVKTLV